MAPPGFAPPGYSTDGIPQSFKQKRPVPEGFDTNTRAYFAFFSYLGSCILLTLYVIQKLLKNYIVLTKSRTARPPPKRYVLLLSGLAAASLLTTWYYEIEYFKVSYKVWLMWRSYYDLTDDQNHWGLWLRDTELFKEAWGIAIVGNARYWWTHQIFFFACALGLTLEQKGVRRGIKHTWVFMVIGQIASISFATNLLQLALLLSPPAPPPPSTSGTNKRKWLGPWLINLISILATLVAAYSLVDEHYWWDKKHAPVVVIPHVALLVLPFARGLLPSRFFKEDDVEFSRGMYKYLWGATIFGELLVFWKISGLAYNFSGLVGMFNALLEHPAVSTVGVDVIFCYISWFVWWRIQKRGVEGPTVLEKENDKSWGSGTTVTVADDSATLMKRR